MSSTGPSKNQLQQLVDQAGDKEFFVVAFKGKKDKQHYVTTVSETWIDNVSNTTFIPPSKLMRKSTLVRRTTPDEKTWLEYDIIKRYGPYDYDGAKKKEKEISAGESESDSNSSLLKSKRKVTPKPANLPGEKSSSEEDEESHSDDDEVPSKKTRKATSGGNKTSSNKTSKSKNNTDFDDEEMYGFDDQPEPTTTEALCKVVVPGMTKNQKRSDQQAEQVMVDLDILADIQKTQHAIVRELQQRRRAEERQPAVEDGNGVGENDPLPVFPLRTFKASVKFNLALRHPEDGELLKRSLMSRLKQYAGESISEYTINMLDYMLEEQVIEKYSWSGQNNPNKKKFKGTEICKVMIDRVMESWGTKKQIEKSIRSHLQHAEERHCRREKLRQKEEALRREMEEAIESED
ncbi:hypothetical protein QAD02_013599 [Eretmocerus hayati]|uniref:Uncharacterized protein n=1 Tax=Eretmocerus hayati TaxID=131215 RepID=A0ACC2P350_9HYME|nr:hypothetical protein QAD02_013599 [Eretmocerus hayati]